jgi:hypothetical protein
MHAVIMHAHTTRDSIMHVPLNLHRTMLNLVHRPTHQYFLCITTLHHTTRNLGVHTRVPLFSHITTLHHTMPSLSVHTHTMLFSSQYHFALRNTNLSAHTCAPIFSMRHKIFIAHHAFLVRTPMHTHFYMHQFLVNSIAEIGAFAKMFPNFQHRHSATMKFVQFHPDNTNSTSATTNSCWLTFLE